MMFYHPPPPLFPLFILIWQYIYWKTIETNKWQTKWLAFLNSQVWAYKVLSFFAQYHVLTHLIQECKWKSSKIRGKKHYYFKQDSTNPTIVLCFFKVNLKSKIEKHEWYLQLFRKLSKFLLILWMVLKEIK